MRNVFYDINVGETDWFVAAFQTVDNSFVIDPLWCVKAEELENWITENSDQKFITDEVIKTYRQTKFQVAQASYMYVLLALREHVSNSVYMWRGIRDLYFDSLEKHVGGKPAWNNPLVTCIFAVYIL